MIAVAYEYNKLHQGLEYEQYAEIEPDALRAGMIRQMMTSMAHYRANRDQKLETDALRVGRAFHLASESPEKFRSRYVVSPDIDRRTKYGKEKYAEFLIELPKDAIVLKQDELDMITGMLNSMSNHSRVKNILKNGIPETSLWVKDPETGITLKCRPDFITEKGGFLIDLKTTRCAHPDFFERQIFSKSFSSPFYVLQAAHYNYCLRVAGICKSESMTIIAVEKEKPYDIWVYPLDVGCIAVGEQWRAKITREYAKCLEEDVWPGYPQEVKPVSVPQWAQHYDWGLEYD